VLDLEKQNVVRIGLKRPQESPRQLAWHITTQGAISSRNQPMLKHLQLEIKPRSNPDIGPGIETSTKILHSYKKLGPSPGEKVIDIK
jgi:hypothetical protein